jgi:hypothetical protein
VKAQKLFGLILALALLCPLDGPALYATSTIDPLQTATLATPWTVFTPANSSLLQSLDQPWL